MKRWLIIPIVLLAVQPLAVVAAEEDIDTRLREAEQRLEQAARELAELNLQFHGDGLSQVFRGFRADPDRAMLGINIGRIRVHRDDGSEQTAGSSSAGVEILAVTPGGPADEAGLVAGDVIIALDGERLAGGRVPPERRLLELMDRVAPGDTVRVGYLRDGEEGSAAVVPRAMQPRGFAFSTEPGELDVFVGPEGERGFFAHFPPVHGRHPWHGMELVTLTPKLGRYFDTDTGLLVVRPPQVSGLALEEGDVILTIGGATPRTVPDAMRLLRFYQPGDKLPIEIVRDGRRRTLEVIVPQPGD